jgi:hypothetical protein
MAVERSPQIVRKKIDEALVAMLDLGNAISRKIRKDDLGEIEPAADKVKRALEDALAELNDACCDIEAAASRL